MKTAVPCLLLCLLAGCSTTSEPTEAAKASIRPYIQCNVENARRFSQQQGDVISLAVAAEAACQRERFAMASTIGPQRADNLRRTAIEGNAADIAKARS